MKNKNLHSARMELIENLLQSVNSKQELSYLKKEKHFLEAQIDYFGEVSTLPLISFHGIIQKGGMRNNGK